jgi:hypothetical protein
VAREVVEKSGINIDELLKKPIAAEAGPAGQRRPRPVTLAELATMARLRRVTWRESTKGSFRGASPGCASGRARAARAAPAPLWLLIEEQADGKNKYAFSNLPEGTGMRKAVALWKSRWRWSKGISR